MSDGLGATPEPAAGSPTDPPPAEARRPSSRPVVYVLCGLPFAGKSTLARQMTAALGLVHLEVDAINRERGLGGDGRELPRAVWAATYRESFRRLERWLAEGRSVVYDATNFRRVMRDRLRRIAAAGGARSLVVLVGAAPEEIAARRERNRRLPRRPDVPEASFAEVRNGFEPPGDDEIVVRYDPSRPIAEWLDRLREGDAG